MLATFRCKTTLAPPKPGFSAPTYVDIGFRRAGRGKIERRRLVPGEQIDENDALAITYLAAIPELERIT